MFDEVVTGFRTHPDTHAEVATITGLPVVSLELIDPRSNHRLATKLCCTAKLRRPDNMRLNGWLLPHLNIMHL